eukprot:55973-Rhodomonas_salina.1
MALSGDASSCQQRRWSSWLCCRGSEQAATTMELLATISVDALSQRRRWSSASMLRACSDDEVEAGDAQS